MQYFDFMPLALFSRNLNVETASAVTDAQRCHADRLDSTAHRHSNRHPTAPARRRAVQARARAGVDCGARLEAVVTTAAMPETGKSAWCREQDIYPAELAEPQDARASPQATRQDRKRINKLERELLRKDRALAETAALLVLSKKVTAIFSRSEDA